ncbi:MAG: hypothetical protein ACI936_000060 [Paraglaciecola sp.]|jgi:hypothetical protein
MKTFVVLTLICFSVIHQAHASLISWDAFDAGDAKAVKDQSSGLVWLSLDLTAGIDYSDADTYFDSWIYASYQEVRNLLDSFFPNITFSGKLGIQYSYEQNCSNTSTCYSLAGAWQNLFGSVAGMPVNGVDKSYQTRSFGLYSDENGLLRAGGAYLNGSGSANIYGSHYSGNFSADEGHYYSTFLIKSAPKTNFVNVPGYSSLLIVFGVFLMKRRKSNLITF